MPTSVRLDEKTRRLLQRLANRKACTKSEIIREAIEVLAEEEGLDETVQSPYELIEDLIGCASGGPGDLSTRTGERFRSLLIGEDRDAQGAG